MFTGDLTGGVAGCVEVVDVVDVVVDVVDSTGVLVVTGSLGVP